MIDSVRITAALAFAVLLAIAVSVAIVVVAGRSYTVLALGFFVVSLGGVWWLKDELEGRESPSMDDIRDDDVDSAQREHDDAYQF